MNKGQLVEVISTKTGLTRSQAESALNTVIETITQTVKKGDNVTLIGFGTFSMTKRAARKGKNPRTGEAIKIAARKIPKFSPGQSFKNLVNGTSGAAKAAAPKAATASKAAAAPKAAAPKAAASKAAAAPKGAAAPKAAAKSTGKAKKK